MSGPDDWLDDLDAFNLSGVQAVDYLIRTRALRMAQTDRWVARRRRRLLVESVMLLLLLAALLLLLLAAVV